MLYYRILYANHLNLKKLARLKTFAIVQTSFIRKALKMDSRKSNTDFVLLPPQIYSQLLLQDLLNHDYHLISHFCFSDL